MIRRLAAIAALAVAACTTLRSEHAMVGTARPPWPNEVRVIMEGAPVPPDAEEIAIVSATGVGPGASLPEIIRSLQSEAASLGANAVVRVRYDVGSSQATGTGVAVFLR